MSKKPMVLIADDNEVNLRLLEVYLADLDCEVVKAKDGFSAGLLIHTHKPQLAILNYKMSYLSGLEVLEIMQSDSEYKKIPIIILSDDNDSFIKANALKNGALDFLVKPILQDQVVNLVNMVFVTMATV